MCIPRPPLLLEPVREKRYLTPFSERNLQACWPESNVLIEPRYPPVSSELGHNAVVKLEALTDGSEWLEQAAKTLTLLHSAVAQA